VMPIKTRIDMLATGIKTPVGIKVAGPNLKEIERIGERLEEILSPVSGTRSVYSERVVGGRYIKVDINRVKAARYGLNIQDLQTTVQTAIGGVDVTQSIEGLERYPVNVRYLQKYRDNLSQLKLLPILTNTQQYITLADVAHVYVDEGAAVIKSENARLNGWTYIDIEVEDLAGYVQFAQQTVQEQLDLPAGYSLQWSGQYEYMIRAQQRFNMVMPLTLAIIAFLLYMSFRRIPEVVMILLTMPFSLLGGVYLIHYLGFQFSVAVGVGFIALAGVSVEIGVLMLLYLNQSWQREQELAKLEGRQACLSQAIIYGASQRLRPILMTAISTMVGLLPIMYTQGTGSQVMQRIAAPMVGGMLSTLVLTLLVLPVVFFVYKNISEIKTSH